MLFLNSDVGIFWRYSKKMFEIFVAVLRSSECEKRYVSGLKYVIFEEVRNGEKARLGSASRR
jgi:hypothetical protein